MEGAGAKPDWGGRCDLPIAKPPCPGCIGACCCPAAPVINIVPTHLPCRRSWVRRSAAEGEAAPPEERGSIYAAFPPVGGDGSAWQAVQSCTQAGGFVAMQQRMLGQTESFWPAITTAGRTDGQRVPWRVL